MWEQPSGESVKSTAYHETAYYAVKKTFEVNKNYAWKN